MRSTGLPYPTAPCRINRDPSSVSLAEWHLPPFANCPCSQVIPPEGVHNRIETLVRDCAWQGRAAAVQIEVACVMVLLSARSDIPLEGCSNPSGDT